MVRTLDFKSLPELAVIGYPLSKTFSPVIQNSALRSVGLNWEYSAIPVEPENLFQFLKIASQKMIGLNVTIPYKSDTYKFCNRTSNLVKLTGAVNTLLFKKTTKEIFGYNTDVLALIEAFKRRNRKINSLLCLGAGGSASAVILGGIYLGAEKVYIANRTIEKAQKIVERFKSFFDVDFEIIPLDENQLKNILGKVDSIVNCIPEQATVDFEEIFPKIEQNKIFCDYSYSEKPTVLYTKAKNFGYEVISGLEILIYQGVYAFEIFTGKICPIEVMFSSLKEITGSWWLEC